MEIRDILQQFNIPTAPEDHHHRTDFGEQIDCPWCSPNSGKWRMGITKDGHFARCWSCGGYNHSVVDTLVEITHQPWEKIKDLLKQLSPLKELKPLHKGKIHGKLKIPEGVGPLLPAHRNYLRQRGFDPEKIEKLWGLQGLGIAPRLGWRILIPVYFQGRMVSWTTRAITEDTERRYLNAEPSEEEISPKQILFGSDFVRHAVVICEGAFDAMRIGPGAVATMGLAYSRSQLSQMANYPVRIVVFDNEPQAQDRAKELCKVLTPFPGTTSNVCLDAKDPGCADPTEIQELRNQFLE